MNPYQYVGDNPETQNDPSGHCWPLCTMLIGAALGAAISVGTTVVTNAIQGKPTTMGDVVKAATVGAVSGAIAGLAGPEAGPLAKMAIGALSSGVGQVVSNAFDRKPLLDGVGQAVIIGGVTGGMMEGGGEEAESAASDVEGATSEAAGGACGLSFRSDTLVVTPRGEQTIGTLKVGEPVLAYNPSTKSVSTQTVQQVFINHDTDLIDVTLAVHPTSSQSKQQHTAVVSHGSHAPPAKTEVVHTTQKHPWLTTKGWITAGQLHLGNEVQLLDGSTATVVDLKIVPGMAAIYDLTVSNVHTFAVGINRFIVHNTTRGCGVTVNEVDSYSNLTMKQATGAGMQLHHVPANSVNNLFGIAKGDGASIVLSDATHAATRTFRTRAIAILNAASADLASGVPWNQVFRQQLANDLEDLRGLGVPNSQLQQLTAYWRSFAPYLMRK